MKTLSILSKKAEQFCYLSGLDVDKVKEAIKTGSFSIQKCKTKAEMDEEGVDYSLPYAVWNPYNIDVE